MISPALAFDKILLAGELTKVAVAPKCLSILQSVQLERILGLGNTPIRDTRVDARILTMILRLHPPQSASLLHISEYTQGEYRETLPMKAEAALPFLFISCLKSLAIYVYAVEVPNSHPIQPSLRRVGIF